LIWLKGSVYWRGDQDENVRKTRDPDQDDQRGPEVDIILLDIFMPVMDGLTCVRRIREWEDKGLLALPPPRPKSERSGSTSSLTPVVASKDRKKLSQPPNFQIPVLAVSANARMEQIKEALRAGMNDSITKPFRIPDLWPKIQNLVPRLSTPNQGG
jgi:CheY-like chemotaxis protein